MRFQIVFILLLQWYSVFSFAQDMQPKSGTNIPELGFSRSIWADFDGDDQLDLLLAGDDGLGEYSMYLMLNNGDDTFSEKSITVNWDYASFLAFDENNDSNPDLLIAGTDNQGDYQTRLYRNDGAANFTEVKAFNGLTNVHFQSLDINKDGKLDVAMSGINQNGDIIFNIFKQSNNDWETVEHTIPAVYNGALEVSDINKDGYPDLLLSGSNTNGTYSTFVYFYDPVTNDFIAQNINAIQNLLVQNAIIIDFNADGYLDLLLSGTDSQGDSFTKLISYDGLSFQEINDHTLPQLRNGALTCADVNADGIMDVHLFGLDNDSQRRQYIYYGNGDFTFTNSSIVLPGMINGQSNLLDYNGDGLLDLFVTGLSIENVGNQSASILYENNLAVSNEVPAAPINLQASNQNDSLYLAWEAPLDDHSPSQNLYYQVQLTNAAGEVLHAASSNLSTAYFNQISFASLISIDNLSLFGVPQGEYNWQVQAIDQGKRAGSFSTVKNFVLCEEISLGEDVSICKNDTLSIQIGGIDDEVKWFSVEDGTLLGSNKEFELKVESSFNLVAEVTNLSLGCVKKDTVFINVDPLPEIGLPQNDAACIGEEVQYTVELPGHQINWYSTLAGQSFQNQTQYSFIATAKDSLFIEAINLTTQCSTIDTLIFNPYELPIATDKKDTMICIGSTLEFTIAEDYPNSRWFTTLEGEIAENTFSISRPFYEKDTVFIEKFNVNNCSIIDTLVVGINPLPIVSLGGDKQICYGDSILLDANEGWESTEWFSQKAGQLANTESSLLWEVLETDTLIVEVMDEFGCINRDSITIEMLPLPNFNIHEDTAACIGEDLFFDVGAGFSSVNWYSQRQGLISEGPRSIFFKVEENDTLFNEVFNSNGCVSYDTIVISAITRPHYNLTDSLEVCAEEILEYSIADLTDEIQWFFKGDSLAKDVDNVSFKPTSSGYLTIETTNDFGCTTLDSIYVTRHPLPVPDLGMDFKKCFGGSYNLKLNENFSIIQWYGMNEGLLAEDVDSITLTASTSRQIWVEVVNENGCLASDTINISVEPLPTFELPDTVSLCLLQSVEITPNLIYDSLIWENDAGDQVFSDTLKLSPQNSAYWKLFQWNAFGCFYQDSVYVEVFDLPIAEAGNEQFLCIDETTTIGPDNIQEGYSYHWLANETLSGTNLANPEVSPAKDQWYYLTVENIHGCKSMDSVFIGVDNQNIVDAGNNRSICLGDFTSLGGDPTSIGSSFDYTYNWSPAESLDNPNSPSPVAKPDTTTLYTVRVQVGNCRVDSAQVLVKVNPLPELEIISDTTVGPGAQIELFATGGEFYNWRPSNSLNDPSVATPIASPLKTTTYTVEVQDSLGCIAETSVTIFVENELMVPNLFSPNGDRVNDRFMVYGTGIKNILFQVFSREGQLLYETRNPLEASTEGWDGEFKGAPQPKGTYIWVLKGEFYDGTPITWKGKNTGLITLIR